jgi:outer membrane receptor for ferrienterochelin and colicins
LGDIAPHKFNLGLLVPVGQQWSLSLRGNFVGERELYTRNPLRWEGKTIDPYFVLNGFARYQHKNYAVGLKALNIVNQNYFHPGLEGASSGDDPSQRSLGYQNSLLPQPERSYWLTLEWSL